MWDVFISYSRANRTAIFPLKEKLDALGLAIFFDVQGGVEAGDSFPQRIADALTQSRVVLAAWTPYALTRPWCRRESFMARELGSLLPVALEPLAPADLKEFIDASYESLVDYTWEGPHFGWAQVLTSLAHRLDAWAQLHPNNPESETVATRAARLRQEAIVVQPKETTRATSSLGLTGAPAIWERMRVSTDHQDLLRFADTFRGTPEAFEARRKAAGATKVSSLGKSPREIWADIFASCDIADIQRFAETFSGSAEALEARRLYDTLSGAKDELLRLGRRVAAWAEEADAEAAISQLQFHLSEIEQFARRWPLLLADVQDNLRNSIELRQRVLFESAQFQSRRSALWDRVKRVAHEAVDSNRPAGREATRPRSAPGCFGIMLYLALAAPGIASGALLAASSVWWIALMVALHGVVVVPAVGWRLLISRPREHFEAFEHWRALKGWVEKSVLLSYDWHEKVWQEYFEALEHCASWRDFSTKESWPDRELIEWAKQRVCQEFRVGAG